VFGITGKDIPDYSIIRNGMFIAIEKTAIYERR